MKLLIVGAGGHGKCCYEIAQRMKCFECIDFIDDYADKILDRRVKGTIKQLSFLREKYDCAFVALGNNQIRNEILEILKHLKYTMVTLIDPLSFVSQYASIDEGSVVFPYAVIEASASIGKGCIISSHTTVHHDSIIDDYSLIYSQCVIRPTVKIEAYTTVPSGSVILGGK